MATASALSTTTTKELITSSPYHLSSNDQPHHVLTPFLLNGENYEKWAKIARNNLAAKHKLGLVDGSLLKPATDSPDYQRWVQVNSMLCGWLYACLDPQVQKVISFVDNAKVLWDNLRVRYSIGNASCVHQIKSSIARCAQDGQSVADYFGQLKVMWDDLDDFEPFIDCCCNSPSCPQRLKQQARRDLERIHQFLMGLDASRFGTTRTNILSRLNRDTNMTLDHVYSEVIAEEHHLIVARSKEERIDAVSFAVKAGVNAISSATRLPQGPCTHCGRTSHTVDTCFELHGLPEWWIEKHGDTREGSRSDSTRGRGRGSYRGRGRGRSSSTSYRANNAQAFSEADLPNLPGVSKATWSAIVNLLKPDQTSGSDKLSGKHSCVKFLLDFGASHHMTGDDDLLVDTHDIPRSIVVLPNGKHTYATKEGTMILGDHVTLNRVLYVPDLSCTLISLARLCRELSCYTLFTDTLCVIQDRTSKMLIGAGEERDGVYHFLGAVSARINNVKKSSRTLWDERLGHPSTKILSSFFI
ncbi:PREDICTED: uncharacterized protein LOC104772963 [Camelina sativa]|uniref:Uncharacterized protein LOC104772963 n=1 Tax=Camelina sativa TaxID=90675 RepID=A0ABM0Y5E5_CAMSA|nr:PREDICTED: uncharacterized protein LOC104772963 [Camelina sativa]